MIIEGPGSVTQAVLSEIERAPDPRFREIMTSLVKHLHAFISEVKLPRRSSARRANHQRHRQEHQRLPQRGRADVGVARRSTLVRLLNNGKNGRPRPRRTCSARSGGSNRRAPKTAARSCARQRQARSCSSTPGPGSDGKPVADAQVESAVLDRRALREPGPTQADMNLRGKFTTGKDGRFSFRSIMLAGYPIPIHGPVGDLFQRRAATTCGRPICTS